MNIPEEYLTQNKRLNDRIVQALEKQPVKRTMQYVMQQQALQKPKVNKYNVAGKEQRTYKDGTLFASKGEMLRWDYLSKLAQTGAITDLERQVPFVLEEGFYNEQYGEIGHIVYVADFVYTNLKYRKGYEGQKCVEDSKGYYRSPEYRIKRKLFLKKYNFLFFEV